MTLAHDVTGEGPALLLLHSAVGDRRMWDPQWRPLADAGYQVIRCDLRGHGRTPPPDRPYDHTTDVVGLLTDLGVEHAALIGSSAGGQVALETAARHPELVTALALLCSAAPGHRPGPALRTFIEREDALLSAGDIDAATDLNLHTLLGPDADADTRELVRHMQRHNFTVQLAAEQHPRTTPETDLSRITAPSLIVSGAHDLPDFRQIATDLAARLPGARHHELPWAGHLPNLERPAEITALLSEFLHTTLPTA
jgi:3-oxoadipate enol-lactonase